MKITVLTNVDRDGGRDEVVDQVAGVLRARHEVAVLEVFDDVRALVSGLEERRPDLVFNLCEMFGDDVQGDARVAALLAILRVPFTGSGAAELFLRQDKGLAKKMLAFDGILYPNFAVFTADADLETGGNLRMPLFVKPLHGDASLGIAGRQALVHDCRSLLEQVLRIHEEHKDAALAEEYIAGRELSVGVLGNREPEALAPIELDLAGLPADMPAVADRDVKFDEELAVRYGIEARLAELPDELRARLQKVAVQAYRALRVRDYGRVDLRLTAAGEIYVLEVNANCYLARDQKLAMAAEAAGHDYPALIERIVQLAVERQGVEPQRARGRGRKRVVARGTGGGEARPESSAAVDPAPM